MSRKPIIAANWKMNIGPAEGAQFIESFKNLVKGKDVACDVEMCIRDRGYRMLAEMGWMYLPVKEPYPPLWHLQEMLKKNELELFYLCPARLFQIYCVIHIDDLRGRQCRELYHLSLIHI